jgi:hypothetical protein
VDSYNSRNTAEVLRRNETLSRNSAHDYESSSLPKRIAARSAAASARKLVRHRLLSPPERGLDLVRSEGLGPGLAIRSNALGGRPGQHVPDHAQTARSQPRSIFRHGTSGHPRFCLKDCRRPP